ncbi:hypothetical protein H310_08901 [Aphanomyces invadans]|uniref:Uncharacterized protein n=1 Tax=Aphanomyces invadans TaxID=157072 RepID=A0A024TXT7_9STRA|nr:hypothetical protein H310_08901 [Aphanomyces invadans]ETV98172.1 hypothetical protein H310_08901 [Aphanomyces invadans]|eukprot:XP_008873047.1 hypothetical protein H310_08901 [Aphanomyces invadans]
MQDSRHTHQDAALAPAPAHDTRPSVTGIATEDEYFEIAKSYGIMKQMGTTLSSAQTAFPTDADLTARVSGFAHTTGFVFKTGTTGGTTRVYTCKSSPNCPFLITVNISKSTGITRISRRLNCFRHNHPLGLSAPGFQWGEIEHPLPPKTSSVALAHDANDDGHTIAQEPSPPPVLSEAEYFATARALGLCKRAGPTSVKPVSKVFKTKEDLLARIVFLAVKVGFQLKHRDGTFQYSCKSVQDCPFTLSVNVRPSGTAKMSEKLCVFPHNHPFGVLNKPETGKNTTLNSAIIAHSIAASGMDWFRATHVDFRNHCIATFGVPIGPTRSTTVRRELESPNIEIHAERFRQMDMAMRAAVDRVRATLAANPTPPSTEDIRIMRQEMHHRWAIDRRKLALEEQAHMRAEEEARLMQRAAGAKLREAEIALKVALAKARHELTTLGLTPDDIDATLTLE